LEPAKAVHVTGYVGTEKPFDVVSAVDVPAYTAPVGQYMVTAHGPEGTVKIGTVPVTAH